MASSLAPPYASTPARTKRFRSLSDPHPALVLAQLTAPMVSIVLGWLFAVGACIGSFMNVVIYRLPAGLSLLHPPSRCPRCETPIRASDNVPILGWLWLRGRCRQCGAAISVRYPAVELLTAVVFLGLAWREPLGAGQNLPVTQELGPSELWSVYAYHLFLLCSLICAAFMEFDGHRLTWRVVLPAFVVGLAAPILWTHLRPTSAILSGVPTLAGFVDGLVGLAAGMGFGYATGTASSLWRRNANAPRHLAIALGWVGAFLGWQAVIVLGLAATMGYLLVAFVSRSMPALGRIGPIGCLAPCALLWIWNWRTIAQALGLL